MKSLVLLIFLAAVTSYAQWNNVYSPQTEGDLSFASAKGTANFIDNSSNCYVTGYVNVYSWSRKDIVTIKYNPLGDTAWVRTYNGSANSDDEGTAITVDGQGNVYVAGYVTLTLKYKDMILLKYNSSGTLLWARSYGITGLYMEDRALGIALDASNSIYVTGYGTGSTGNKSIVISKYDTDGNKKWTKLENGTSNYSAEGYGIVVDNAGNIIVTGYVTSQNNWEDIILNKYNSSGTLIWSTTYNNSNYNDEDKAWGIVVDTDNNIYVSGHTTLDYYSGNTDAITLKFNSSGALLWESTFGGNGNEGDKAWGIVVDTDGSVYIGGYTTDAYQNQNYLTVKYNSAGARQWHAEYNGTGNGEDYATAIGLVNINGSKSVIVTGASWGTDNNHDYATVRYNSLTGSQTSANRYSMTGASDDVATDLAIVNNIVCITGFSELIFDNSSNSSSMVTQNLKYGNSSELNSTNSVPVNFGLGQNFPNPFNPSTTIEFSIPNESGVKLRIYDLLGKQVDVLVDQVLTSGAHSITFNASRLSSGIYFYEITTADGFKAVKKMNLIK